MTTDDARRLMLAYDATQFRHFEGYYDSRHNVRGYSRRQLLDMMDALYGVPDGVEGMTDEDVLHEALRQHERDWRVPEGRI